MCKIDNKIKFFHNWQVWQKVMFWTTNNLTLSTINHSLNFASNIFIISKIKFDEWSFDYKANSVIFRDINFSILKFWQLFSYFIQQYIYILIFS